MEDFGASDATGILPRLVRRCQESRLPRWNEPYAPRYAYVEYELLDALVRGGDESSEALVSFLQDKEVEDRVLWVSERCFLRSWNVKQDACVWDYQVACCYAYERDRDTDLEYYLDLVAVPKTSASDLVAEGDTLLRIVAGHVGLYVLVFRIKDPIGGFHVSAAALALVVGHARPLLGSRNQENEALFPPVRSVSIRARLTAEQKRILSFGCHRNVELWVLLDFWSLEDSGVQVLVEAIRQNACPRKLLLLLNSPDRTHHFRSLMEALEGNTCLESLRLFPPSPGDEFVTLLIRSLPRVLRLRHLGLARCDISSRALPSLQRLWEPFWSCVATHPTLQSLQLIDCDFSMFSAAQLEEMAACLQTSTTLQFLTSRDDDRGGDFEESIPMLRDRIFPVLRLNRFRLTVAALVSEPVAERRARGFGSLLQDESVRTVVGHAFYLLTESNDAFVDVLSRRRTPNERLATPPPVSEMIAGVPELKLRRLERFVPEDLCPTLLGGFGGFCVVQNLIILRFSVRSRA